ncbi:GTPase Era [Desulfobacterota bacterium AH_259_B03_O07]|nr:GTPase Era [Desulfobacterota bacterium AH_259_B03_O07]
MNNENNFHSGFISIVGSPNVGKSTLLNVLIGKKLSAVSKKPNTTRNRILGIKTLPNAQLIFLDTPGIQRAKGQLGKAMVQSSISALGDADVILLMIDVKAPFNKLDSYAMSNLSKPAILLINKIDLIKRTKILEIIEESQNFDKIFTEVIPISALKGSGIDDLIDTIIKYLPVGPLYFPGDMITDIPEKFLVAECIREKVFNLTYQEIPYKTAVFVEEFEEVSERDLVRISAIIYVERKNHKGIIIGNQGQMLKQIGTLARVDIERILDTRVYLKLWVKVKERWTERADLINEFGYAR